jgi:hypothetical protein
MNSKAAKTAETGSAPHRGIVRRPKADDFRQTRLAAVLEEAGSIVAESTEGARGGASLLLRFGGLLVLLTATSFSIFAWLPSILPQISPLLIDIAAVAFFGIAFWAYGFDNPWREKLGRKRERLAAQDDTAEMRRHLLALQSSQIGGLDVS